MCINGFTVIIFVHVHSISSLNRRRSTQQWERSADIARNLQDLDEERRQSEELLYMMIPRQIADRLRNGEDPISTCQVSGVMIMMMTSCRQWLL